jgi:hypothetical protein
MNKKKNVSNLKSAMKDRALHSGNAPLPDVLHAGLGFRRGRIFAALCK